jgi:threonylcarbamoyladenosine tRNA methylthiotransferase MtaB
LTAARTVSFATLGCRLNQVDTRVLQTMLEARGFKTVDFDEPADVVVVNTCTVTARAEFSDRQMIRRAARVSPDATLVVTGCWAQTSPNEVAALSGVDLVVGNADKDRLPDLLEGAGAARTHVSDIKRARISETAPVARWHGRSRAFSQGPGRLPAPVRLLCGPAGARVQPEPRPEGRPRSGAASRRVRTPRDRADRRRSRPLWRRPRSPHVPRGPAALARRDSRSPLGAPILAAPGVLHAGADRDRHGLAVVAPHFHIPLQSGSARVLRLMRRPYDARMYRALIERLVAARPGLGLAPT